MVSERTAEKVPESDSKLLSRIAKDDHDAWEKLINRFSGLVYSLGLRILGDPQEAEDAMQETFMSIRKSAARFKPGTNAKAWIATIASREALMIRRRRPSSHRVFSSDLNTVSDSLSDGMSIERDFEKQEVRNLLKKLIDTLPEACRIPVVMHFGAGMTQEMIAKELNSNQRTISDRMRKGMEQLRSRLATAGITGVSALTPVFLMESLVSEQAPKQAVAKLLKVSQFTSSVKAAAVKVAMAKKTGISTLLTAKTVILTAVTAVVITTGAVFMPEEKPVDNYLISFRDKELKKYGFKNIKGDIVIEPIYDDFRYRYDDIGVLRKDGKYGALDLRTGETVIPFVFNKIYGFSEGLAAARKDAKYGFIDKQGNFVIPPRFAYAYQFGDGLAPVQVNSLNSKWGYIDRTGKIVIPPRFDMVAGYFRQGRAQVILKGRRVVIDKTGKVIKKGWK